MELAETPNEKAEADPAPIFLVELAAEDPEDDGIFEADLCNMELPEQMWATDDVKGGPSIPEKVVAARSEEMKFAKDRRIYEYYKMEEALDTNECEVG